ncbi:MAG: GntG family PLP-dependent aldolase [Clostridiales bacterium]|nr:GntG family PLP-dependent aldolase [Clostridiales bacterium]
MDKFIDMRSDTVTFPTPAMRDAMFVAEVGDDVYGDDPTVAKLEVLAAGIVGKEAALFVPSGTFGNQLSLFTHCKRGDEVILGEGCHIIQHEVGAASVIAGVQLRQLKDEWDVYRMSGEDRMNISSSKRMDALSGDGVNAVMGKMNPVSGEMNAVMGKMNPVSGEMNLAEVAASIRKADLHSPATSLLCLENAHSNGRVVSLLYMAEVYKIAVSHNIPIHLDGARLFNAATYLGCSPSDITCLCDSVMFCLSKGLCAPVGSILSGTAAFIDRARRLRKLMGGGMRQAGIIAAAGIIALRDMTGRLGEDHANAKLLANRLSSIPSISINPENVQINMVFFRIDAGKCLNSPTEAFPEWLTSCLLELGIKVNPPDKTGSMRLVTHYWTKEADVMYVASVLKELLD